MCRIQHTRKVHSSRDPALAECRGRVHDVLAEQNPAHYGQLLRVIAVLVDADVGTAGQVASIRGRKQCVEILRKLPLTDVARLSVGELAGRVNSCPRQLSLVLRKNLGVSTTALTLELRLLQAASLLRDSKKRVVQVADQCGFNHLPLFNACFKRRFGMAPKRLRKALRANVGPASRCPKVRKQRQLT